ncbi:TPA: phosphoribosylglycinamide formyltransferase [Candidatus Woesearchaeota archaeon]|nr:phosphoribosylglycinamide formyltransferase [Candidatus Woesearchaeota archaeon]
MATSSSSNKNNKTSSKITNIAVLASGKGTNLQSIIDKIESGYLDAKIAIVISDKADAIALERAKKHKIAAMFLDSKKATSREEYDKTVVKHLEKYKVDVVVLAGFMRLLSKYFVEKYKNRLINIHPSLLPSFPGIHGYEDAWEYGVKVSGCTVHFVDEGCDTGPIILQKFNPIKDDDTFESFKERGLKIEHEALPEALKLFCEGRLKVEGRKVRIL